MNDMQAQCGSLMQQAVASLPLGVRLTPLVLHEDERGSLIEVFRQSWPIEPAPVQWNFVSSKAGVLRGVHVHLRHHDYLVLAQGRAGIGLCDLRSESPTRGLSALIELSGRSPQVLAIPTGVAHGFYYYEDSVHIYSVSEYFNPSDELGCMWNDAALQIPWPVESVVLSERDKTLPSLATLMSELPKSWGTGSS